MCENSLSARFDLRANTRESRYRMTGKPQNSIHPRKFKEKIELLKQKEAELNANFLAAMRDMHEIRMATNIWEISSQKSTSPTGLQIASDLLSPKENLSKYEYDSESRDLAKLRYGNGEQRDNGVTDARIASEAKPPFSQQNETARNCSTTAPLTNVPPTTTFSTNSNSTYRNSLKLHPCSSGLQSGNSSPLPPTPTTQVAGGLNQSRRSGYSNSSSALVHRSRTSPRSAYGSYRQAPYLRPQPYPPCYPRVPLEGNKTPQQQRLEMPTQMDSRAGLMRMNLIDYRRTASDSAIPNSFDVSQRRRVEQLPPVTELTKFPHQPPAPPQPQANSGNGPSLESPYYSGGSSYPSVLPPPPPDTSNGKTFSAGHDSTISPPSFPASLYPDSSSSGGRQCFQRHTSPPAAPGAALPSPLVDCPPPAPQPPRMRYPSAAVASHPALNCIGSASSVSGTDDSGAGSYFFGQSSASGGGGISGSRRHFMDSSCAASTGNLPRCLDAAFNQTLMPDSQLQHPHPTTPLLPLDQHQSSTVAPPPPAPSRFFLEDVGGSGGSGSAAMMGGRRMHHHQQQQLLQPFGHPPQRVNSMRQSSPYGAPPFGVSLADGQMPKAAAQSMYLNGSLSMQNIPSAQGLAMRTTKLVNDPIALSTPQFKVDPDVDSPQNFSYAAPASGLQPINQFAASLNTHLPSSGPPSAGLPPITGPAQTSEPAYSSSSGSVDLNNFSLSTEHERRDSFTMAAELFSRIEKRNAVLTSAGGWTGNDDERTTASSTSTSVPPTLMSSVSSSSDQNDGKTAGLVVSPDEKVSLATPSDVDPFFLPLSANDYQLLNDPSMADYVTDDLTEAQLVQEHYMGTNGSNICSS